MKIRIEEELLEGSPSEIIEQILDDSFEKEEYSDTEEFLAVSAERYSRFTDISFEFTGNTVNEKAKSLIYALQEIDALEVIEDD